MFITVVSLFLICWLPYNLYFLYIYHRPEAASWTSIQDIYLLTYWLAMANSSFNPIIYYTMNKRQVDGLYLEVLRIERVCNRFKKHFTEAANNICWRNRRCNTVIEEFRGRMMKQMAGPHHNADMKTLQQDPPVCKQLICNSVFNNFDINVVCGFST